MIQVQAIQFPWLREIMALASKPYHTISFGGREFPAVDSEFLCVELHGDMQVMGHRRPGRLNLPREVLPYLLTLAFVSLPYSQTPAGPQH